MLDNILDLHGIFLQEGFAVLDPDQAAVMTGEQSHSGIQFVDGGGNNVLTLVLAGPEIASDRRGLRGGGFSYCLVIVVDRCGVMMKVGVGMPRK